MYRINDLIANINPYRRTFINYSNVFNIQLSNYYIRKPASSDNNQIIHEELYQYFYRNKAFVDRFYTDWHTKRTMQQLADDIKQDVFKILDLFNQKKVYMHRSPLSKYTASTEFRYYSTFQIIEILTGKQVIERPKSLPDLIYLNEKFKNAILIALKQLPNPETTHSEFVSWEKDLGHEESPYTFPCELTLTFKKYRNTWRLYEHKSRLFY